MRLIDVDTLVKNLGFLYTKNRIPNVPIDVRAKETLTTIMEQATAYDVDKVVEQLEELKSQVPEELSQLMAYDEAIKIVKAGGKNE